jgi:hypothetical protein
VGTNRRYAHRIDAHIERRIDQVAARPRPLSLTDAELDKDHHQVRVADSPIPVRAWVRASAVERRTP